MNRLIGVEAGRLLGNQCHRWDPAAQRSGSSDAPRKAPSRNRNHPYTLIRWVSLVRNGYDGILQKMRDTLKM